MDEKTLADIEARANGASPAPWVVVPADDWEGHVDYINAGDGYNPVVKCDSGAYPPYLPDAEFIAHARSDVPALVAEVKRLRALLTNGVNEGGKGHG